MAKEKSNWEMASIKERRDLPIAFFRAFPENPKGNPANTKHAIG
jgi:hypothetical protein